MAWSGGNFTRANPTWTSDANFGIGIEAGRHDAQDNDFTAGIDQCLNKSGQNSMTGDLNLGGYKITNTAAATTANGVTTLTQIQSGVDQETTTTAWNITKYSNDVDGRYVYVRKSRGATVGTNTIVSVNDNLGTIFFQGANGTGYDTAAAIAANVDDTPGASNDMPGRLRFLTTANGSSTLTERMRIDSSGRVGIGVSNPTYTLDVDRGSSGIIAAFRSGAGRAAYIYGDASSVIIGSDSSLQTSMSLDESNDRLLFNTANVERMRIDGSGRVGINTQTASTPLTVGGTFQPSAGAATNPGTIQIKESNITALTTIGGLEFYGSGSGSGYGSRIVGFDNGSMVFAYRNNSATWTESARIDNAGRVGIGTTTPAYQLQLSSDSAAKPTTNTWTIASDERIKTNVQPYAKGLAEICQVNPITYDYNGRGGIPAGPGGVSILAQELQPVFPECVGSYKGKLDEGDEEDTEILNYNGHAITFALINAVKELNAKVEALEAKVQALEAVTEV